MNSLTKIAGHIQKQVFLSKAASYLQQSSINKVADFLKKAGLPARGVSRLQGSAPGGTRSSPALATLRAQGRAYDPTSPSGIRSAGSAQFNDAPQTAVSPEVELGSPSEATLPGPGISIPKADVIAPSKGVMPKIVGQGLGLPRNIPPTRLPMMTPKTPSAPAARKPVSPAGFSTPAKPLFNTPGPTAHWLPKKANANPYIFQAGAGGLIGGGIGALAGAIAGEEKDSQGNVVQSRADRVKSWLARGAGIGAGAGLVGGKMLRDAMGDSLKSDAFLNLTARNDLGLEMPKPPGILSPRELVVQKMLQSAKKSDPGTAARIRNLIGLPDTLESAPPTYGDAVSSPTGQQMQSDVSDAFLNSLK